MDISLIISIIGCVTGIFSLIIVIMNNVFQVGKQRFSLSDRNGTYYFKANETTIEGPFRPDICAVASIKVTNQSSYPITIDDAYIGNQKNRHMNGFKYKSIEIPMGTGVRWCDCENIVELPIKLDPFETMYFAFAFPFFTDSVKEYGKASKVRITIVTARKKYHLKVSIPEYHSIFERA